MTEGQKKEIKRLRESGIGYTAIAGKMGVQKETVRSFCRRNGLADAAEGGMLMFTAKERTLLTSPYFRTRYHPPSPAEPEDTPPALRPGISPFPALRSRFHRTISAAWV